MFSRLHDAPSSFLEFSTGEHENDVERWRRDGTASSPARRPRSINDVRPAVVADAARAPFSPFFHACLLLFESRYRITRGTTNAINEQFHIYIHTYIYVYACVHIHIYLRSDSEISSPIVVTAADDDVGRRSTVFMKKKRCHLAAGRIYQPRKG